MRGNRQTLIWGWVCVLLLVVVPAQAQKGVCTLSPNAAVDCFVRNGVSTGLLAVPPGMNLAQYRAYGIAVSNVLQTPSTALFLLGTSGAVADAMPPANADGSPNQAAQEAAVNAIVDSALRNGLITLPQGVTGDQLKLFARNLCAAMPQNNGVNLSPGALLRLLDSFVVSATGAGGTVGWVQVSSSISPVVDGLISSGLLKLPAGVTANNVKQFALDVAMTIQDYKIATGRTKL